MIRHVYMIYCWLHNGLFRISGLHFLTSKNLDLYTFLMDPIKNLRLRLNHPNPTLDSKE